MHLISHICEEITWDKKKKWNKTVKYYLGKKYYLLILCGILISIFRLSVVIENIINKSFKISTDIKFLEEVLWLPYYSGCLSGVVCPSITEALIFRTGVAAITMRRFFIFDSFVLVVEDLALDAC